MPVNFNGSYSQNFDSLATTGTTNTWTNDTTLVGWSLFRQPTPGTAITAYAADSGTSTTGSFYSYGATGNSDRALGGLGTGGTYFGSPASGAIAGWIAFSATAAPSNNKATAEVGSGTSFGSGCDGFGRTTIGSVGFGWGDETPSQPPELITPLPAPIGTTSQIIPSHLGSPTLAVGPLIKERSPTRSLPIKSLDFARCKYA